MYPVLSDPRKKPGLFDNPREVGVEGVSTLRHTGNTTVSRARMKKISK